MASLSDLIEDFILSIIGEDSEISLSRNEMATHFNCAPSQINYVLQTRFNYDNGYGVDSKRGGGGYIRLYRINSDKDSYIGEILGGIFDDELSYNRIVAIVNKLIAEQLLAEGEGELIKCALSDKALRLPVDQKDELRKNIFREMLVCLLRRED